MMKKIFYLALTLIVLSAASMNAQVRIGGLTNPDESAVLDLNPDTGTGSLGLALPRVELISTTSFAPLQGHVAGMTVYNTKTMNDVTPGAYCNDGNKWVRVGSDALTTTIVEVDSIVGNEVTGATEDGGLLRAGSGTAAEPYTLSIADKGVTTARLDDQAVTTAKIADNAITPAQITPGAVTAAKLNDMGATNGQVLSYNGSAWLPGSVGTLGFLADGSPAKTTIYLLNSSNSTWNPSTGVLTPADGVLTWGTTKIAEVLLWMYADYMYNGGIYLLSTAALSTAVCDRNGEFWFMRSVNKTQPVWALVRVWVVD
jgi:hypothetical protein